ncbi:hypothetical protein D3C71_1134290 [compost metagenome]
MSLAAPSRNTHHKVAWFTSPARQTPGETRTAMPPLPGLAPCSTWHWMHLENCTPSTNTPRRMRRPKTTRSPCAALARTAPSRRCCAFPMRRRPKALSSMRTAVSSSVWATRCRRGSRNSAWMERLPFWRARPRRTIPSRCPSMAQGRRPVSSLLSPWPLPKPGRCMWGTRAASPPCAKWDRMAAPAPCHSPGTPFRPKCRAGRHGGRWPSMAMTTSTPPPTLGCRTSPATSTRSRPRAPSGCWRTFPPGSRLLNTQGVRTSTAAP